MEEMIRTATDAVFNAGRKLPRAAYHRFLVSVIHSAAWCLREVSGAPAARSALESASLMLDGPAADSKGATH